MKHTKLISFISIVTMALMSSTAVLSQSVGAAKDGQTASINADGNGGTSYATATLENDTTGQYTLKLTAVPDIVFAPKTIDGTTMTLTAASVGTDKDQITVVNPGTTSGWNVKLAASKFVENTTKRELRGAQLKLGVGEVVPDTKTQVDADETPTGYEISPNEVAGLITSAKEKQGYGTWKHNHKLSEVSLTIPSTNIEGTYTSTLTWTLGNTPE
ncbi:WxL domain-containing protein [Lapidilactobacillus wuchangensis]|uniref:WxL domain-containing protein n=1 Tax=Lapidilactobacillus wuchangensis TaxID=2486001 RepID=UPI000F7B0612|nr:WxL domain-containing protein [Lapidilactobacillus wuchangensis]